MGDAECRGSSQGEKRHGADKDGGALPGPPNVQILPGKRIPGSAPFRGTQARRGPFLAGFTGAGRAFVQGSRNISPTTAS